ncbi:MAG: hypothetical protein IT181_04060 [Acidobacteria bacterium]|nr:hypothetical protein [Acidobacteriota bacterium]
MTVREFQPDDEPLLDQLAGLYPFKPYRDYRVWPRTRQHAMLMADIARSRAVDGHFMRVAGAGAGAVIGSCRPLTWDSTFFGVPMARIDWLRGPAAPGPLLTHVLDSVLAECRSRGIRHLTAKADVADMEAIAALEAAGFRTMDVLATYFTHPRRQAPPPVRDVGQVRPFEPRDEAEVLAITAEAFAGFRGRFQLDPWLPRDRSDALYLEWARQCCGGRMADRMVVADNGKGGLAGWASTRRVEPASSAGGVTLWAGSLGACRREHPGAYAGLIRELAAVNHAAGEVTETQTQLHNVVTVRVYVAVGAQYVRSDCTLHAWLG